MARNFSISDDTATIVAMPTKEVARLLHALTLRLYTENRMDADEMRDSAQSLQVVLDAIWTDGFHLQGEE